VDWVLWWAAHGEAVITLIVGAVIGAFVNWVFFRKSEKPKRLSWEVMSRNAIISADAEERRRLEVLYDGDPVDDPNIILVRLGNTGKREILEADFPDPIRLDFGAASVLTIQGMESSAPGINARWHRDPNDASIVLLKPQLLNKGEWFDMKFVTDGKLKKPKIEIRFAGQSAPAADLRRKRRRRSRILTGLAVATYLALGFYFAVYVMPLLPGSSVPAPLNLWLVVAGVLVLAFLFSLIRFWTDRLGWRAPERVPDEDEDDEDEDEDEEWERE
jgi:phosphate transport system substrate-binding protein